MGPSSAQQELFPQSIELSAGDFTLLSEQIEGLSALGISISLLGQNTIAINALPSNIKQANPELLIRSFIDSFKENTSNPAFDAHQKLAASLAKASAIPYNRQLEPIEMQDLVDKLFACQHPNIAPDGKPTISILGIDELDKRFR